MLKNIAVLTFFIFCLFPLVILGSEKIETAALFFNNDRSPEYQDDVDRNVLELARNDFSKELSISLARSLNDRSYIYRPEAANRSIILNQLFHEQYFSENSKVFGSLLNFSADYFVDDSRAILKFLKLSFKNPHSIKILFLYGHGEGALGFKDIPTALIKDQISAWMNETGLKLDLVVLDSCFLGNFDFLYQMHELSRFTLASPESEFSAGQPFDVIESLLDVERQYAQYEKELRVKKVAEELLMKFLTSYSAVYKGKDHKRVVSSSALFSLIDNNNLKQLISPLKNLRLGLDQFSSSELENLNRKLKKYQMENPDLIDLGGMLLALEDIGHPKTLAEVKKLKNLLDLNSSDFRSVSPQVNLRSPMANAILKIGINNWSAADLEKLDPVASKHWQKKANYFLVKVNKVFKAYPFLPHVLEFNAQWIDEASGQKIGNEIKIVRSSDLKIHSNKSTSPVLVFGFTESAKTYQKSYSGLAISHPLRSMPGFDYLELDFQQATNWLR